MKKDAISLIRVGSRIKSIRINKGLTMEEFGSLLQTSKGTVNNWEKGRNLPHKENLKAIADLENISVNQLLYGSSQSYLISVIKEIIKTKYNLTVDHESANLLFNSLPMEIILNPYQYDSDSLFREQKDLFDNFLLNEPIYNKWGLVEYSTASLKKARAEIYRNFKASSAKDKEVENEIFDYIIKEIDQSIHNISNKYGSWEDEANSIELDFD